MTPRQAVDAGAVSTGEYAERVGTSPQIVRRWIREGRLDGAVEKDSRGRYLIRPDQADALLGHSDSGDQAAGEKPAPDGRVSVRQFAHRMGVSVAAVRSAIQRGRLDGATSQNRQGHYRILEDLGRELWNPKASGSSPSVLPAGDPLDARSGQDADAERKRYEARVAKLRWEKEAGLAVAVAKAIDETTTAALMLRDQMRLVGRRVREKLPKRITPKIVEAMIDAEVDARLEALSQITLEVGDEEDEE